jgi:hypothetical protein
MTESAHITSARYLVIQVSRSNIAANRSGKAGRKVTSSTQFCARGGVRNEYQVGCLCGPNGGWSTGEAEEIAVCVEEAHWLEFAAVNRLPPKYRTSYVRRVNRGLPSFGFWSRLREVAPETVQRAWAAGDGESGSEPLHRACLSVEHRSLGFEIDVAESEMEALKH